MIATSTLIAGATGFIGGHLATSLARAGAPVRCLARDRAKAQPLEGAGMELHVGDITDAESLIGAGRDVETAYFLVHAMAGGAGFAERERAGALNFARMAKREGVGRVVYLGGLGDEGESKHLQSRHQTARVLAEEGPPLTYFRAAMVVGAESESYRTLRYLVSRLPLMIAPSWLRTATQPIGIDDVVEYLRRAPDVPESESREVQIGGADVLSYSENDGPHGDRDRQAPPPQGPRPLHHTVAVCPLAWPRHPRRRQGGAPAGRGIDHSHGGHRPLGRKAIRHLPRALRRGPAPGACRGSEPLTLLRAAC